MKFSMRIDCKHTYKLCVKCCLYANRYKCGKGAGHLEIISNKHNTESVLR
jgi:hypothetical protein